MRCPVVISTMNHALRYKLLATAADSYYQVHETCNADSATRHRSHGKAPKRSHTEGPGGEVMGSVRIYDRKQSLPTSSPEGSGARPAGAGVQFRVRRSRVGAFAPATAGRV